MIFTYPALVHDNPARLWLEFPDLPGCQTFFNWHKKSSGMAGGFFNGCRFIFSSSQTDYFLLAVSHAKSPACVKIAGMGFFYAAYIGGLEWIASFMRTLPKKTCRRFRD